MAKQDLAGQVVVEATDDGYLTSVWMKAKPTRFVCGSDVRDDGYYQSYGSPAVYTFSNDVMTYVLKGSTSVPVSMDAFMKQQDDCLHNPNVVAAPGACLADGESAVGFAALTVGGALISLYGALHDG